MKEKFKKIGSLSVSQELSRNEQKKILGGRSVGHRCANSTMNCTNAPIDSGYCRQVYPSSNGQVEVC